MSEDKKTVPEKSKAKPGFFARSSKRIQRFFREMRSELKKVVWPSPKQLTNNTIIVMVMMVLVGVAVAGFDLVFKWATTSLYGLGLFS